MLKGSKMTDEQRKRVSLGHIGVPNKSSTKFKKGQISLRKGKKFGPHSEETKRKISLKLKGRPGIKGRIPYNKGKHLPDYVKEKLRLANTGKKLPEETKKKISLSLKGKKRGSWSGERKEWASLRHCGPTNNRYGKKQTIETRRKISLAHKGDKAYNWKNGITPEQKRIYHSVEYKIWSKWCKQRDNYICAKYNTMGGKLVVHHIKNFAEYPELRFNSTNGITLSVKAHIEFHRKYGYSNNTLEQIEEFIGHKLNL
jgi:hypothetical protein